MGGEQSTMPLLTLRRSASVGRRSEQLSKPKLMKTDSADSVRNHQRSLNAYASSPQVLSDTVCCVESLDLQGVEWEGYVEKKGHVVRNWKQRYLTLEGNVLSYYESKEDARRREGLKGRVSIREVKLDERGKSAHGHDFVFESMEGKHFHLSCETELDRRVWVHMIEAGIDFEAIRTTNQPVYGSHTFSRLNTIGPKGVYSMYHRVLTKQPGIIPEFLFYFSKDVVITAYYPRKLPCHGDFYGREGLLYLLSTLRENAEIVDFNVTGYKLAEDMKSASITGYERLRSRGNDAVIEQPWRHYVRFGPNGRIVRLKIDIDPKEAKGAWSAFECFHPYKENTANAVRSTRALSLNLHDFTVYHVIGKGGFGTVVNAKKKSDGQTYALKILEKGKMTKYDIESSFTEMRVAQNIHHPFIAGLRIAFQSRTKLFLGMNYYAGGDLFHHMSKGSTCRIAPARARFYTAELILGIHHLHKNDILYRDIKPENVMIDISGHIALVDFGLAKLHVSNYKGAKTMAGSPQYTAPELLLPKGKRSYGKAADWWSLGILLYEMNIGKSPFFDSNVEKMYKKIQQQPVKFPSKPPVSDELKDILQGLLCKDPHERYGNVISDLLDHPYFKGINWDLLLKKEVDAPWKPNLTSDIDVGYVDSEFTDLDAIREVASPSEKTSRSKSFAFIEKIGITKSSKKSAPPATQDPTFKDFNYFCEDPDALVEVQTLCGELREKGELTCQTSTSAPGELATMDSPTEPSEPIPPTSTGTPLASFVENGQLDYPISPQLTGAYYSPIQKPTLVRDDILRDSLSNAMKHLKLDTIPSESCNPSSDLRESVGSSQSVTL